MLTKLTKLKNPLSLGLALVAGTGLVLTVSALGWGVVQTGDANMGAIGGMFLLGLVLFVLGVGGWVVAAQPHRHFDDINVPKYTGHHDHPDDEHAIVVAEPHAIESVEPMGSNAAHHP